MFLSYPIGREQVNSISDETVEDSVVRFDERNISFQFVYFIVFGTFIEFSNSKKWIVVSCIIFAVMNLIIFAQVYDCGLACKDFQYS